MSVSSLLIFFIIIFALFSTHYCGKADKGTTDDEKAPLTKTKLQALAQQIGKDKVRTKENGVKITSIRDLFIRQVTSSRRKRDYIAKSLEQSDKEYHLPRDIRGIVVSRSGKWAVEKPESRDETVGAILEYAEVRVRTKFMDRLKALETADRAKILKDGERKTYKELLGMDTVNTKPLPQKGCRLSLVVKEDTKLDAYLWELGMAYTSKDVKKQRKTLLDLEMLYKGSDAFSEIATLDFSMMPQKEEENEGNSFKELISLLKEMLLRQYRKLESHIKKTPEQREQDRKNKEKDPLETVFIEETDEEAKKELLESMGDILKSEDPEIPEEKEPKPDDSPQNRENYTYLDIVRHNPKPFDFLKEKAHFEIVAKPVGREFSKLKSRDYISIMRILREEHSDYGMLGTETFNKFAPILNENDDNVQNCYEVSKYLNKAIYYNPEPTKPDPAHSELLGRLGAQVLNSVINAKKLSIDLSSHM
ncbi:hypothetical protein DdX_17350 [Ditylenchus destructor]|uniref:Uncharacterized protein n=1 Tax=Ditylenchus destructor TaxID=166010 RepID=A0AAD4QZ88_9BILA|nr:hypothetical protein DdX_17350 [Ditylenchus destructor]